MVRSYLGNATGIDNFKFVNTSFLCVFSNLKAVFKHNSLKGANNEMNDDACIGR